MTRLTEKQERVLKYLALCQHSTRNIMKPMFGTSVMTTLNSLERRGLITLVASSSFLSNNYRAEITDAGRAAAGE